ncbi:lipopolysaccharide transport periplasmic protein LptA [Thermomonas sp. HDW16]|uniref:lipopolysaccharide transport periplasmic protein LptA n=1 Tax=Thermomonas sp. HDW16 TaxID=2714945 RepID=UPI001409AA6B|nr:lipopolysaccharide transport periplasmic protein LptA [Thermomonas sp. HDW16]QIL20030.1 lipopolysaccharide transport periplasmic protein LptA [Thermomonas sp. HDW16]
MSRRTADLAAAALALFAAVFAAGANARSSDRTQPMDIEAAHSTCSLGANDSCTLTGNVTMTQGSLNVVAAKAIIEQSNGDPSRALLSGGVTLRQTLDDGNPINATASNVDYNLKTEVVVFTGNVTITQQRGTLNGQRVVYNMKTGQVDSGGAGNGRVKMRILPKGAQPAPAKASN